MRARIRKEMETPATDWDNEWQEIPGTGGHPGRRGAESQAAAAAGQDTSRKSPKLWDKDPIDTIFDLLIEDKAFTDVAVFGMSEPDVALALAAAVGLGLQRFVGHRARRPAGQGASAPPRLRHIPAHPAQIRARGKEADAGGSHPQVHRAAGAAHAARRSRRAEAGNVGRHGGLRSGDDARRGDVRRSEPLSEGMGFVLVNGVPVIDDGKMTDALPGKVLRGAGYEP